MKTGLDGKTWQELREMKEFANKMKYAAAQASDSWLCAACALTSLVEFEMELRMMDIRLHEEATRRRLGWRK
jgi:hypothetical protein